MEASAKMALRLYQYNSYLECDEYKLDGSNARLKVSKSDGEVLDITILTDPNNQREFCFNLAQSFEQIAKEFECASIALKVSMFLTKRIVITQETAKTPEKIFKRYKNCGYLLRELMYEL